MNYSIRVRPRGYPALGYDTVSAPFDFADSAFTAAWVTVGTFWRSQIAFKGLSMSVEIFVENERGVESVFLVQYIAGSVADFQRIPRREAQTQPIIVECPSPGTVYYANRALPLDEVECAIRNAQGMRFFAVLRKGRWYADGRLIAEGSVREWQVVTWGTDSIGSESSLKPLPHAARKGKGEL